MNKIAAYYAEKFNDQATLNWLKLQHPYVRSRKDDLNAIESMKRMLMGGLVTDFDGAPQEGAGSVPARSAFDQASEAEEGGVGDEKGGGKIPDNAYTVNSKIKRLMVKRGWSAQAINETIANPVRTAQTSDSRHNAAGVRNSDFATAYFDKDGNYVVRNDVNGNIVQVSDRLKPWKIPTDFKFNP